jgi:hypothetical protein
VTISPHHTAQNKNLFAALAKAQAEAKYVKKDKPSNFGDKPYAASEDIINDCKEHLNAHGISLLPLSFAASPCDVIAGATESDSKTSWLKRPIMISRFFKLCHESGEFEILGPYDWPTNPNNMNTNFTAFGGTDTFSLAYVYRDILGMPRLTPQEVKQFELEEQKMKQALAVARAENGESAPVEKKAEKPKEQKAEAKPKEAPAAAEAKAEAPKQEAPKQEAPKQEAPKADPAKSTTVAIQPAKQPAPAATVDPNAGAAPAAANPAPSAATPASSTAPTSPGEAAKSGPPQQGAVSAPSASSSPSSTAIPTTNPAAPTPGAEDQILRDRQTAILQRLQRHASKRIKELNGDATALEAELNAAGKCPGDKPVMLDGKFRRSGLTTESIRSLDEALRMVGV